MLSRLSSMYSIEMSSMRFSLEVLGRVGVGAELAADDGADAVAEEVFERR